MSHNGRIATLVTWIVLIGLVASAAADTVTLRNGDRLTGKVVTVSGGTLVFHSSVTDSDIEIPWDGVVSLQTDSPVPIQLPGGREVMAILNVPAAGDARIVTAAGDEESIDRNDFVVKAEEADEESPWSGNLRLDFATTQGNSNTATLGTSARVQREGEKTVLSSYFTSYFQRSDGDRAAENYSWGVRFDYKFTERAYGYAAADWLSDSFRELNLRTQLGVGGGYKLVEEEHLEFAGELGATYTHDDYKEPSFFDNFDPVTGTLDPAFFDSADDEYVSLRIAERLEWEINDRLQLRHFAEYLPNVEDFGDYLLRAVVELRVVLDKNLYLELGAEDRYDETPPKGVERNDLRVYAAIGYAW